MRSSFVLIASFLSVVCGALPKDVSTWGASEVAEFFYREAGANIAPKVIADAGIQGDDLFDGILNDAILEHDLGVNQGVKRAKILKAIENLDREINLSADSIWEWRAANIRLSDFWLMTLINSAPSTLLLWSRFVDSSQGVLDKFDDPIDECNIFWFWLMVIFIPYYPFYSIISANPIGGFAGMVMYFFIFSGLVSNIVSIFAFSKTFPLRMTKEFGGLVAALFCYYILYWFIPRFFMDLWLYFAIYIAIPAQVFFMLLGTLAVVGVAGLLSSK